MRIVFMGTPDFAVPCLDGLLNAGYPVVAAFTQPDKPKGRGYAMTPPPVKTAALARGVPVYQPSKLRDGEALTLLRQLRPDLIVVVAYGKILSQDILTLPPYGCVNIHASLLPKYRGAAPIQWAVLRGERETGVTAMQMDAGIDTGDMLLRAATPIGPDETAGELHDRLSRLGAQVLLQTLARLETGTLVPEPQDDSLSCHAPMLDKSLCPLDFKKSAQAIHDQIRGLSPWPVAVTRLDEKTLKIHRARLVDDVCGDKPGEALTGDGRFCVACGDGGAIEFLTVQYEGGKRMAAADFLRGHAVKPGILLGDDLTPKASSVPALR